MDSDQAATARARAEARRQKILARQKDRLSSITGTHSKPEGEQRPVEAAWCSCVAAVQVLSWHFLAKGSRFEQSF